MRTTLNIDDHLLKEASRLTGIEGRTALVKESLRALIEREGLPIGLHVIGPAGGEATVFAASAAFEEARPWIQHRPPVG